MNIYKYMCIDILIYICMYMCVCLYPHILHTFMHIYITLHYITLRHVTSRHVTSRHVMLRYVSVHYITLGYVTLHYITLHYITLHTYIHYNICNVKIHIRMYTYSTCTASGHYTFHVMH